MYKCGSRSAGSNPEDWGIPICGLLEWLRLCHIMQVATALSSRNVMRQ